jgi:type IV secretory pathway VirB2 component (pilin)
MVVLWFLLWSMAQWRDRKRLIGSFAGTMAVLVIAAEVVSPHWIPRFLRAVREYPAYGADLSVVQLFLPSFLGKMGTAALVCALCAVCWYWRKAAPGSEDFAWTLAWVSAVTIVIVPKLAGYNQPLLIPALLVLVAQRETIWKAGPVPRLLAKGVLACQLWQWIMANILSFCSLLVPARRLSRAALVPEYTLFSLSALTVLTLITVTYSRLRTKRPTWAVV